MKTGLLHPLPGGPLFLNDLEEFPFDAYVVGPANLRQPA